MKTLEIHPKQFKTDLIAVTALDKDGYVEIEITNHLNGGRYSQCALAYLDHAEQIKLRDFLSEQIKGVYPFSKANLAEIPVQYQQVKGSASPSTKLRAHVRPECDPA